MTRGVPGATLHLPLRTQTSVNNRPPSGVGFKNLSVKILPFSVVLLMDICNIYIPSFLNITLKNLMESSRSAKSDEMKYSAIHSSVFQWKLRLK